MLSNRPLDRVLKDFESIPLGSGHEYRGLGFGMPRGQLVLRRVGAAGDDAGKTKEVWP